MTLTRKQVLLVVVGIVILSCVICLGAFSLGESWTNAQQSKAPSSGEGYIEAPSSGEGYICNAEIVGTPVSKEGECINCTINYSYDPKGVNPGAVFVVYSAPMKYYPGAFVYQYPTGSGFLECALQQPFNYNPGYYTVRK